MMLTHEADEQTYEPGRSPAENPDTVDEKELDG